MELNDILSLVKAGYTKDEIATMALAKTPDANPVPFVEPVKTPAQNQEPSSAQVVEPVPSAIPVAQPVPTQQPVQPEPTMAELMQAVAKLTSAVQANAIAQSVIPQGLQKQPTAEDMIAEIIRPTVRERSQNA